MGWWSRCEQMGMAVWPLYVQMQSFLGEAGWGRGAQRMQQRYHQDKQMKVHCVSTNVCRTLTPPALPPK